MLSTGSEDIVDDDYCDNIQNGEEEERKECLITCIRWEEIQMQQLCENFGKW